jgi:hypothetical protein
MLASLRVAPVPRRAFDPPCAPGEIEHRSAPRNGRLIMTTVLWQRQRATPLGSIWLRQCPSVSGAFSGEATRPAINRVALYAIQLRPLGAAFYSDSVHRPFAGHGICALIPTAANALPANFSPSHSRLGQRPRPAHRRRDLVRFGRPFVTKLA